MHYKTLLVLTLLNGTLAVWIDKNDVTCTADGSVNVKKSALGSLSSRIVAFGGGRASGHCHRVVRDDVVQFQRQTFEESPVRMIIEDKAPDVFHILDVLCTIIRSGGHSGDHPREKRAGVYRKEPDRDENGNLITGPEVNNTGLDENGNLVRDRTFDVNVGMKVNVPFADNDEAGIYCQGPQQFSLLNPDPAVFNHFLAYDDSGKLCNVNVRPDGARLVVTNCNTNRDIKVAFNDREFKEGVIGGRSVLKVYKVNCMELVRQAGKSELDLNKPNIHGYYYMYSYNDYLNSCPELAGTIKQVCLLVLTLTAALFMERLILFLLLNDFLKIF